MNNKIVVVGSSNVDLIMKMERLPQVGETITGATFMQTFGGKGANQAVAAARAGGDDSGVCFVNCVGAGPPDGGYGELIVENLRRDGIDVDYVFREDGVASGTALVMIGAGGENYLSVAPGANYCLSRQHVGRARGVIEQAAVVVLQCEIPADTIKYTIDLAHKAGRRVLLNFAPARFPGQAYLPQVSILVVNEVEAAFLCGRPVASELQVAQVAEELLAQGPQAVILTLGADGAYVASGEARYKVDAYRVEAVDTTAAGDAFCGSLAVALAEGRPLVEGVRFASAAAAITVTRLGAQPSIPHRAEIESLMEEPTAP